MSNKAGKGSLAKKLDFDLKSLSKLIISIFRLNGRIVEWGDLLGAPLGLTSARWQIMGAIGLAGEPLTAPQISSAMGVTRQGAQKQLNILMEEGLIKQMPNPRHDRSYLYALTSLGKEAAGKMESAYAAWLDEVTSGLSGQALVDACELLNILTGNIENIVIHKNGKVFLQDVNKTIKH